MYSYLGIDLGTSSVKVILIDPAQRVIASASSPLDICRPHPGWSEQNPADWVAATEAAIEQIQRQNPTELSAIKGIGLSGQMHGATLLDANDRPLRPCILWNDTRSHAEAALMNSDARFQQITGNLVFPGFTAPKLAWIRRNETGIFTRIAKILLPKDYLRLWLSGEYISEMSDASGTSWLDVQNRRWSPELLAATGLEDGQMPRLVEGTQPVGILKSELAMKWGIPEGVDVVLAGGAGDNAASACGLGTVRPGTAFLSIGTSGVFFTAVHNFAPNPERGVHTFCHALPGIWHQMGVSLSATDSLNWLAKVVGTNSEELIAELGTELRPPTGVIFLPYLSGERTPHNDAMVRGAFIGLSHQTDRRALTQAVLEGVAFSFRDIMDALDEKDGNQQDRRINEIIAIGGGSQSAYWLKAIATALDKTIEIPSDGDGHLGAAFGAARLGLIAAENVKDPMSICTMPTIGERIEPNGELRAQFEAAYHRFKVLYPAIKGI